MPIDLRKLCEFGLPLEKAESLSQKINEIIKKFPAEQAWHKISKNLLTQRESFHLHFYIFLLLYPEWLDHPESSPVWIPDPNTIAQANMTALMNDLNLKSREECHRWSVIHFESFWEKMIHQLGIVFEKNFHKICDLNEGVENPHWLTGSSFNITDSCFTASPEKIAIIYQDETGNAIKRFTYAELNRLSNRVAASLIKLGYLPGDAIAINMPMTIEAVAIYLAIIKMGGVVISIADSFSSEEIAIRLNITKTTAIFTQSTILRNGKTLPLYQKVISANAPTAIVLSDSENNLTLRQADITWEKFLIDETNLIVHHDDPMRMCNILFSSGTTGTPKAIPWNHTTAIKVASDAYLHQNIQQDDVLAWPTNLGWMMGPWLVFAALINKATLALFNGSPLNPDFGKFIQDAKVTLLGVVPTIVASWRQTDCMRGFDWSTIKAFSSTGESSNPTDMFYLMYLANYKPVIEYCGGTEIGGAYLSSTVIEKNFPAFFTTPAMGSHFLILDEEGHPANEGEVAILPPAMGLSTTLLNADHHQVYYGNMPLSPEGKLLRRHGDLIRHYQNGLYSVLGRTDDTMNLGGVKISSAEIERVVAGIENITETAAIASSASQGPSKLVIYAVTDQQLDQKKIKQEMQQRINAHLNPLFKIDALYFVKELPKTASNKIMRRMLRKMNDKI